MVVRRRAVLGVLAAAVGIGVVAEVTTDRPPRDRSVTPDAVTGISGAYHVEPSEGVAGIQRVIDEHGPNLTVVLGAGEYVGANLRLDHGVQLLGMGRNATVIKLGNGANTDLIVTPDPDEEVSMRSRFEKIAFDGNEANNSAGSVVYGAFWNGRFVDCDFMEAPEHAFWLTGSTEGSTDDNYFRGCRFLRANGHGLRLGTNRQSGPALGVTRVENCWFGDNDGNAVKIRGNGNVINNCKFYGNGATDVLVDRGKRNLILNNDLSKRTFTAPCVSITAGKGVTSSENRVSGNTIWGDFQDGVYALADGNAVVGLQVHDNTISSATDQGTANRSGIRAEGGPFDACSARDNTFIGQFVDAPMRLPSSWTTSGNIG